MSQKILRALMQLFAIIARPESDILERISVVKSFLEQQLNKELVKEYLQVFREYLDKFQKRRRNKKTSKVRKQLAFSSVRVLKICTEINQELAQRQKYILVILLLEFIKSDKEEEISEQEMEFVSTVADTFLIPLDEFKKISDFIINTLEVSDIPEVLLINNVEKHKYKEVKHIFSENLFGEIKILHIQPSDLHIMQYSGESELSISSQLVRQNKIYVLTFGASIRTPKIKPIYFSDIVGAFIIDDSKVKINFDINNIEYKFKNGFKGLHNLSFSGESGKMVGIMGASGAGKSTLLNVLNGTFPPTEGAVLINGVDIHKEKEKIEGVIGYVSQDDLLMEDLTVFQNLFFNAKLCFEDYNQYKIIRIVLKLLLNLGLYDIRNMKVGNPLNKKISGGQRKRLNISLELLREPSVLFLDEPTSGLSSRDSENILDLLKELSLKGKLVFIVIHQPSSDIFKMFDKLMILDTGGYLIFKGDPIDSIMYFKSRILQADWNESVCHVCGNVNSEQIFNIVESQVLDEYGNLTKTRKTTPIEWFEHFEEFSETLKEKKETNTLELPEISFKIPNKFNQFLVFLKRDVLSKLSNKQYMFINFLQSAFLAFLLSFIIRYFDIDKNVSDYVFSENTNLPVYIFMSIIVALFIGLTVSAEEIIKDRKILKREAFLNLSRTSYLFSKVAILFALSAFQALSFVIVGNLIMEIRGLFLEYFLIVFSTFSVANMLGLNISDSFEKPVTVYILIPFLIIPQIILSGIIVKFDKLNPTISSPNSIPFYGEMMVSRWAYEALAVLQFKDNEYEKNFFFYDKVMSNAEFKKNYWIKKLENKLSFCERNLKIKEKKEEVISNLNLLRNEISKELSYHKKLKFDDLDNLEIESINKNIFRQVNNFFNILKNYYMKRYNRANEKKDKLIRNLQKNTTEIDAFIKKKKNYYNESLSDLLKNKNESNKIFEYDGHLHRKSEPIFYDPESNFLKSHFYAPRKKLFGVFLDTFWVNLLVLWLMAIILYITLYFKLLIKFLKIIGNL